MLYPFQKALQIVSFSPDFVSQNNNFLTKNGRFRTMKIGIKQRFYIDRFAIIIKIFLPLQKVNFKP